MLTFYYPIDILSPAHKKHQSIIIIYTQQRDVPILSNKIVYIIYTSWEGPSRMGLVRIRELGHFMLHLVVTHFEHFIKVITSALLLQLDSALSIFLQRGKQCQALNVSQVLLLSNNGNINIICKLPNYSGSPCSKTQ